MSNNNYFRRNEQTSSGDTQNQSGRKLSLAEPVRTITSGQLLVGASSITPPKGSCSVGETQDETSKKVYNIPHSERLVEVVNPDDKV